MNQKKSFLFNLKYAAIQGFYWMMFCSVIGYLSTYLLSNDFNNSQIGAILAISNIIAVILQPIIADFVDKQKKISLTTILCCFITTILILSITLTLIGKNFIILCFIITPIITVITVIHPLINSLSFIYEKDGILINFGLARGIGSLSYAVVSIIIGNFIELFSPTIIPMFYVITILGILIFVSTFRLPKSKNDVMASPKERVENPTKNKTSIVIFIKKYKKFMIMLSGAVFILFDHSLINNFFAQIVYDIGGNNAQMGRAISLCAAVELPMMVLFNKLKDKINCGTLLKLSGVLFTVKHFITYVADSISLLYVAQLFQLVSFGLFLPAAVYYVKQIMDEFDATKGQAFVTIAITLGSVFAGLVGGRILDLYGVSTMLFIGFISSFIGSIIMFFSCDQTAQECKKKCKKK